MRGAGDPSADTCSQLRGRHIDRVAQCGGGHGDDLSSLFKARRVGHHRMSVRLAHRSFDFAIARGRADAQFSVKEGGL